MKRILSIILLVTMFLTGCTTATNNNSENEEAEVSGNGEIVEVEFWHALGGGLGDGMNEIIEEFNSSQDKYVVKPVVIGSYSEIDEKLQAGYAAKQTPALVAGGSYDVFYNKGLVEAFEDYMPENYDKDDIVSGFMKAAVMEDKMYFAPAYGTSQVMYYNKSILDEAGKDVDDLSSWQSLAELSKDIIGMDTNINSIEYIWEPMWGPDNIADIVASIGGDYISEDGKTVTINSEEWVEVLEQIRKWIHEDKIMTIHSGGQGWEYWYKTMDDWVYGKSLGYTGSPGDYAIALDAVKNAVEEGHKNEFAVVNQPGWKDNDPSPYFYSLMYYIPKCDNLSEEQKKGAAEFVTFATNTENTAKFSIATGYAAVRNSVLDLSSYQEYLASNPDADAALKQIDEYAIPEFIDPTGGAIRDALNDAVDKVEIENISAKEALDVAAEEAQRELDKLN
ncbi:extracellular solute-binding protein [Clostridium sp. DL1XJH146]